MDILLDVNDYILKVEELYAERELVKLKHTLKELLEAHPDCAQAHYLMGCVLRYWTYDYQGSENHLRLAVKYAPTHPDATVDHVSLLNYMGKYEKAIEAVDKALEFCGGKRDRLYFEKAKALELLGKNAKATKAYKMAIRSTTDDCSIYDYKNYLQRAKKKIKKKKPKEKKQEKLTVTVNFSKPQVV